MAGPCEQPFSRSVDLSPMAAGRCALRVATLSRRLRPCRSAPPREPCTALAAAVEIPVPFVATPLSSGGRRSEAQAPSVSGRDWGRLLAGSATEQSGSGPTPPADVQLLREALADERARSAAKTEILELISRARNDAAPVFDAILRRVADLCKADAVCLTLAKAGDRYLRMVAFHGIDPANMAFYQVERPMDPEVSSTAEAILAGRTIHIANMMDTEGYRAGLPAVLSIVHELWHPLRSDRAPDEFGGRDRRNRRFSQGSAPFHPRRDCPCRNLRRPGRHRHRECPPVPRVADTAGTRGGDSRHPEVISQSRDDETPVFEVILRTRRSFATPTEAGCDGNDGRTAWRHMADYGRDRPQSGRLGLNSILIAPDARTDDP